MLTTAGEDNAGQPTHSEVVDDDIESHLDNDLDNNDLDMDFYDYSYNDADKYVNVIADTCRTKFKKNKKDSVE